jgi:hypothetical protein
LSFYISDPTTPVAGAPPLLSQGGELFRGSPPESGGAERKRRGVVSRSAAVVSASAAVVSASTAVVPGGRFLAHTNAQSQGTAGAPVARKPTSTWGEQKCVHFNQKRPDPNSSGRRKQGALLPIVQQPLGIFPRQHRWTTWLGGGKQISERAGRNFGALEPGPAYSAAAWSAALSRGRDRRPRIDFLSS